MSTLTITDLSFCKRELPNKSEVIGGLISSSSSSSFSSSNSFGFGKGFTFGSNPTGPCFQSPRSFSFDFGKGGFASAFASGDSVFTDTEVTP